MLYLPRTPVAVIRSALTAMAEGIASENNTQPKPEPRLEEITVHKAEKEKRNEGAKSAACLDDRQPHIDELKNIAFAQDAETK